jgi:hypothetical protein
MSDNGGNVEEIGQGKRTLSKNPEGVSITALRHKPVQIHAGSQ